MARRQHVTLLAVLVVAVFLTFAYLISSSSTGPSDPTDRVIGGGLLRGDNDGNPSPGSDIPPDVLNGGTIAPKLENATAKYVCLSHLAWSYNSRSASSQPPLLLLPAYGTSCIVHVLLIRFFFQQSQS